MKAFISRLVIFLIPMGIGLTACTDDYIEPRYDERDRVVGYYDVEEYSETYHDVSYYSIRILKSGYYNEIYLDNFYASDIRVYAVLEYGRIRIPFQVVDGFEVEGSGTVYGNEIRFNYRVKDRYTNSYTDFCETKAWLD